MGAETRTVRIDARVTGDAEIRKISNSLTGMSKSVKQTADTLGYLKGVANTILGASIFGFGVRELTGMADSMTLLSGRITALTGNASKTAAIMKELGQVANDTKSGINDIASVYSRIAVATQNLNISSGAQIGLTKILQQSFRLSGATAEEATASTLQFTQALSFGQLRGQELRSVLSQNAVLAGLFSKAVEGSGKNIYKFAEAGGFTTRFVLKVLADNFDKINGKANTLSQTFEQTMTLAMNRLRVAVDQLNQKFNLNGNFAKMMDYLIDHIPTIVNLVLALGVFALPKLVLGIQAMFTALMANPIIALFAALTFALLQASGGVKGLVAEIITFPTACEAAILDLTKLTIAVASLGTSLFFKDPITKAIDERIARIRTYHATVRKEYADKQLMGPPAELAGPPDYAKQIKDALKTIKDPIKSIQEQIGALNLQFNAGKITVTEFNKQLVALEIKELDDKMKKGELTVSKYAENLRKINLAAVSREFDEGSMTIDAFNLKVKQFKIEELEMKFRKGKIMAGEFRMEMAKLVESKFMDKETYMNGIGAGVAGYLENLGTLASQISKVVTNAFEGFETAIFEATKSGKINFESFTQSVLDDITRMIIRMGVIKPLAGAIGGGLESLFGGGSGVEGFVPKGGPGQYPTPYMANGGAFSGGVQFFADGGVVGSKTSFGMAGGKTGIMGEAGPEAIMPLKRGSDGKLGVASAPVNINIVNNSSAEITTSERTDGSGMKTIDVMIQNKVKEGIGNGSFDRVFQQNFGLQRKGV